MIRPSVSLLVICCLSRYISDVNCEDCAHDEEGDIRLVNGRQQREGRVEICLAREWGTVCDDRWDEDDAAVVCRQLGFSSVGAEYFTETYFGRGDGLDIVLDDVDCDGDEERLIDCRARRIDDCGHNEDAGVRCQPSPPAPQIMDPLTSTDMSVFIAWQLFIIAPWTLPNVYNIVVRYSNNTPPNDVNFYNISWSVQVPGTATEVQFHQLFLNQRYTCCVTAVYDQQTSSSTCDHFETLPPEVEMGSSKNSSSKSLGLVGGILGFVIILLVLLLLVAGMGLAYPRCRSKVKDRSSVSQILDQTMHIDQNPSYIQRPPAPSGEDNQGNVNHDPSYEVVGAASEVTAASSHMILPRSHATAANSQ